MRRTRVAAVAPDADRLDPLGIVIADGGAGDRAPRLSAFVWGPVPDEEPELDADPALVPGAHGEALALA